MRIVQRRKKRRQIAFSMTRKTIRRIILAAVLVVIIFIIASSKGVKVSYHISKGKSYALKGKYEKAKDEFRKSFELEPDNPTVYDAFGFAAVREGNHEKGQFYYKEALKRKLNASGTFNHLKFGNEYISQGYYRKALIEFEHLLKLRPHMAEAYFGLGLSYHALGRINKAIELYKYAILRFPKNKIYRKAFEKALNDKRRGNFTYIYDRKQNPLAKYQLASQASSYMHGYVTAQIIGYMHPKYGGAGIESVLAEKLPGSTVTLTIDAELQQIVDQALGWHKGSVVVLNSRTGEILAAVSHPTFNPNRLDKDWKKIIGNKNNPLLNRAFEGLYEPGSICKIVTTAAFLESKKDVQHLFPIECNGHLGFGDKIFWDWTKHGTVDSMKDAFSNSCNITCAKIGIMLGQEKLKEYAKLFGFDEDITSEFILTKSRFPILNGNNFQTAEISSGLGDGFYITPIHGACLASIIANDGVFVKPALIKEIRNVKGDIVYEFTPTVLKKVVDKNTALKIKEMMVHSVEDGIGANAKITGLTIGGKTGTSGGTRKGGLHAWFVCFAPAEKPEFAICVFVEKGGMGMYVAAPIARKILSKWYGKY